MSGFGQFSQEAYDQLRAAYSNQLSQADEIEKAGVKVGLETLGVETAPFKADWLDKTGLWKYPDGKGDYMDTKQSSEDLLAALRDESGEVSVGDEEGDDDLDITGLSDEEIDAYVDQVLQELEDEEGGDEGEEDDDDELSDEEIDALVDKIMAEVEEEDGDETDEEEGEEEDDEDDAISVAEKIAALKEELAALSANLTLDEGEGEEEVEEEVEEPTEDVEETDSEEDPIEEEEEVDSDDEP
jgi:hypothetical protein